MQVLLSKLFGASSQKATTTSLKADQCRDVLTQVVDELYFYMDENIQTDEEGIASALMPRSVVMGKDP